MHPVHPDVALQQLQWRYATKKFDPARTIAPDLWRKLEQAMVLAPSSYGLQPWKFFVVTNAAVRAKLKDASWGQAQITDASHLVVFSVKKSMNASDAERLVKRVAEVRKVPVETLDGYKNLMAGSLAKKKPAEVDEWMSRQVYIALGMFLTTAAMFGVDACPMEGFDNVQYDEILGLGAKGYGSVVLATAGYRAADDAYSQAAKARFAHDEVVTHIA